MRQIMFTGALDITRCSRCGQPKRTVTLDRWLRCRSCRRGSSPAGSGRRGREAVHFR